MKRFVSRACLAAIVASLLVAGAAQAKLPAAALAQVRYPDNDAHVGYGTAGTCPGCEYAYGNWSGLDPYVLTGAPGALRVAQIAGSTVRLSTFNPATYRD